jgi:hypothetical protein
VNNNFFYGHMAAEQLGHIKRAAQKKAEAKGREESDQVELKNIRPGITKVLKQIEIATRRVIEGHDRLLSLVPGTDFALLDETAFDAETYYTKAYDVLKLAELLLPEATVKKLKRDATYKKIAAIRNHLITHAYDKRDGDSYCGFGWGAKEGIQIKAGSPLVTSTKLDAGFFANQKLFEELLERYAVRELAVEGQSDSANCTQPVK